MKPKIEIAEVKIGEAINKSEENNSKESKNDNEDNTQIYNESSIDLIQSNAESDTNLIQSNDESDANLIQSSDKNNTNLAVLRLDKPGLTPNFKNNIKEYYITVNESINNLELTALPENSNAKINITGNKNLKSGLNTIIIKVNSENNKEQTEYKIYVTKTNNEENANTKLETLAIENVMLEPDFVQNITEYKATVSNNTENLNILAFPENENAKVEIEGANNIEIGDNSVIVTVYAENGITFKKYKITVHRRNEEEQIIEENRQKQNSDANIQQVSSLIDNSTQIVDVKQQNMQLQSQNSIWTVIGIFLSILVLGIVIIRIVKEGNIEK